MRRNQKSITAAPEIVRHIEGLAEANFNILVKLVSWLDAHEKTQDQFRMVVLAGLAKLDARLTEIQGCQLADYWAGYRVGDEKRAEYVKGVEEQVAKATEQSFRESVKFVYAEHKAAAAESAPCDRRRKWHGWEI